MPFAPCTYSLTYVYKADSAGWVWTVKERTARKSWIFSAYLTALDKLGRLGGGAGGIRTLDTALGPYNGLANRRLQPLGHSSATRSFSLLFLRAASVLPRPPSGRMLWPKARAGCGLNPCAAAHI